MSWNFILLIFINGRQVRCESSLYSRINYVQEISDGELLWWECPGIIKTMHTGFSAYTYCIMPTPGADIWKKPDVMISVERFV